MNIAEQLSAAGVEVEHYFADGLYAKMYRMPARTTIGKHVHDYDHLSVLASGQVVVGIDGEHTAYLAPCVLPIKAHKVHVIRSVTDAVWYCIHATDETDPEKVDEALGGWL